MDDKIENIIEFINRNIKSNYPNMEIVEKSVDNLTAPGENYWSDMLRIDLVLKNKETGTTEPLNLCAKCVVQDGMEAQMSLGMFKAETHFYTDIIPAIQKFLKDHGQPELNIFPKLFCARLNRENTEKPDFNAVIISENLRSKGYDSFDRHKGFDFEAAKVVITDLALFHSITLAMKLKDPEAFEKVLLKHVHKFNLSPPSEEEKEKMDPPPPFPTDLMKNILRYDILCRKHLDKFEELENDFENRMKSDKPFGSDYNGPFATIVHSDMWLNNTMQLVEDGKVVSNKFLDFQVYSLGNPIGDLIFLLISSVDLVTLENHFDYLLSFYHEKFIQTLETLKCDIKPFEYVQFLKVLKEAAIEKFIPVSVMNMSVIFAKKGIKHDFHKQSKQTVSDIHPIARAKMCFLYTQMIKRDWFN